MLKTGSAMEQEEAARELRDLASNRARPVADIMEAIVRGGGIKPLVALARRGSAAAQEHAAWALHTSLTVDAGRGVADHGVAITRAGAIEPLVALVRSGSAGAQEEAVWALYYLALPESADNRLAMARAGAIEPLVALLVRSGSAEAQGAAAVQFSSANLAAGVLGFLASENADNRKAIAHAGAIEPLVALVRSGSAGEQEEAATVLFLLALTAGNREAIVQAGAIEPLVTLMRLGSTKARAAAFSVLLCFVFKYLLTLVAGTLLTFAYVVYSRRTTRPRAKQVRRPERSDGRARQCAGGQSEG